MQWNDMKLDEMKERMRWDEVNLGWHEMKSKAMTCNGMKWHDMTWDEILWMNEWMNERMNEWMNEGMKEWGHEWMKHEWIKWNEAIWREMK